MKNLATYLFTPPQRQAIAELARAYASYHYYSGQTTHNLCADAERLLAAQDAVGIELEKRDMLLFIQREAACFLYREIPTPPEVEVGRLWSVGFYNKHGDWQSESKHATPDKAAERVHWLNGGARP